MFNFTVVYVFADSPHQIEFLKTDQFNFEISGGGGDMGQIKHNIINKTISQI